ncbi:hypothetical protein Q8A64_01150 [Oxalobacteraceae bacterium R-40]|uniref:HEPN domain-containing protein n=1 Tax=Keguizhuia sedimenti TaxID=3064264 RepID=A0ABU1BJ55_9BURK|nr:hypothetical protein [Oxalobacteraceae bacterium R-40]
MQKIKITQSELDEGNGRFDDYMKYIDHRLSSRSVDPRMALFTAAELIKQDGLKIYVGNHSDNAGLSVANWLHNFYGDRETISYCYPSIVYQLAGRPYLLRMPIQKPPEMLVSQAVIDLNEEIVKSLSDSQISALNKDYSQFYDALSLIARLDVTTVVHLEAAAQRIYEGAPLYALARWESLMFVERAMKEILVQEGCRNFRGADGHDIKGALHAEWTRLGKSALPENMLDDVMCSPSIRYERTSQPFLATLRAHHSAIRLGALIAKEIPPVPTMEEELSISIKEIARQGILALARLIPALAKTDEPTVVKLIRDNS